MALPTPDQASVLLSGGRITPDQYTRILAQGAAAAGVTPAAPFPAPEAPPPPTDPIAEAAAKAGLSPVAPDPGGIDLGSVTAVGPTNGPMTRLARPVSMPPVNAGPMMSRDPRVTQLRPGVTESGSISIIPKHKRVPGPGEAHPAPKSTPTTHAASGVPSSVEPSREDVAAGKGVPSAPGAPAPKKETREERRYREAEERRSGLTGAENEAIETQRQKGQVEIDKAHDLALHAEELRATREKHAAEYDHDRLERQRRVEATYADQVKAVDDLAKTKVDSRRVWHDMSAGQKVTAGFMAVLGIFGNRHGVNPAVERMKQIVAQDIEVQKANMDNKGKVVAAKAGLLHDIRGITGDEEKAQLLAQSKYYDVIAQKGEEIKARYAAPEAQARVDEVIAGLRKEQAGLQYQLRERAHAEIRAEDAAAAGAAASRAKEERELRKELLIKSVDHQNKMQQIEAEAAGKTSPEKRKQHEVDVAAAETNSQLQAVLNDPIVKGETGSGATALGALDSMADHSEGLKGGVLRGVAASAKRMAPESAKEQQSLSGLNQRVVQMIAAAAKDAEGKPGVEMLRKLEHTFELKPTDTPAIKRQKVQQVLDTLNGLSRRSGAAGAPQPGRADGSGAAPSGEANDNADPYAKYRVK